MSRPCRGLGGEGAEPRLGGRRLAVDDAHDTTATLVTELHCARDQREQRVVATAADVVARVEVGAALADEDLAGVDLLAAVTLDPEPLGVGVTPVARGRRAFLVCHGCALPRSTSGPRRCR